MRLTRSGLAFTLLKEPVGGDNFQGQQPRGGQSTPDSSSRHGGKGMQFWPETGGPSARTLVYSSLIGNQPKKTVSSFGARSSSSETWKETVSVNSGSPLGEGSLLVRHRGPSRRRVETWPGSRSCSSSISPCGQEKRKGSVEKKPRHLVVRSTAIPSKRRKASPGDLLVLVEKEREEGERRQVGNSRRAKTFFGASGGGGFASARVYSIESR